MTFEAIPKIALKHLRVVPKYSKETLRHLIATHKVLQSRFG
jgi:hypothetical protein